MNFFLYIQKYLRIWLLQHSFFTSIWNYNVALMVVSKFVCVFLRRSSYLWTINARYETALRARNEEIFFLLRTKERVTNNTNRFRTQKVFLFHLIWSSLTYGTKNSSNLVFATHLQKCRARFGSVIIISNFRPF
jgi:hypothetical protein